jgi:hypothetical protein
MPQGGCRDHSGECISDQYSVITQKEETDVSELVVIGYKGKLTAEWVGLQLLKMQREYLIDPTMSGTKPGGGVGKMTAPRS